MVGLSDLSERPDSPDSGERVGGNTLTSKQTPSEKLPPTLEEPPLGGQHPAAPPPARALSGRVKRHLLGSRDDPRALLPSLGATGAHTRCCPPRGEAQS